MPITKNKLASIVLVAMLVGAGLLLLVGNAVAEGASAKAAPDKEWLCLCYIGSFIIQQNKY